MLRERNVCPTHDEPDDSLPDKACDHRIFGSQVVDDESAADGAGHVEKINDDSEAQNDGEVVVSACDATDDC